MPLATIQLHGQTDGTRSQNKTPAKVQVLLGDETVAHAGWEDRSTHVWREVELETNVLELW